MSNSEGQPYDVFAAQVGDKITVASSGGEGRTEMVVWSISAAGTAGRRYGAGPAVSAHIRPGGYAVTFDNDTKSVYDPRHAG